MASSQQSVEEPLPVRIVEALVQSAFRDGDWFLPDQDLEELITYDTILQALRSSHNRQAENEDTRNRELSNYILNHAKRLFAIVLQVPQEPGDQLRQAMQQIKEAEFEDSDLPLSRENLVEKLVKKTEFRNADSHGDVHAVWTLPRVHSFYKEQWQCLAPVFCVNKNHENLDAQSILPFTEILRFPEESSAPKSGAFGQVTGYKVHPSHLKGRSQEVTNMHISEYLYGARTNPTIHVAIKKLNSQERDRQKAVNSWEKELDILKKMNELEQKHIVHFLAAFKRGKGGNEEHYLMLEWADGGNLRDFWNTSPGLTLTLELVHDTVHQIKGLAQALSTAHDPPGKESINFRHGDLKPENILRFKNQKNENGIGTLKIGDWGLAKQHNVFTELRNVRTTTLWGTRAYEPPEEAPSQGASLVVPGPSLSSSKKRSRLYDIWAMGCITLEFLIWVAYGNAELQRFDESLAQENLDGVRFYKLERVGGSSYDAVVHPVVNEWMDHMADDVIFKPGETALGDLLEIVRTCLLVVKLPARLGTTMKFTGGSSLASSGSSTTIGTEPRASAVIDQSAVPEVSRIEPMITLSKPDEAKHEDNSTQLVQKTKSKPGPERATSQIFLQRMEGMTLDVDSEEYWFKCLADPPHGPRGEKSIPSDPQRLADRTQQLHPALKQQILHTQRKDYGRAQLDDIWDIQNDNDFAARVLKTIVFNASDVHIVSEGLCGNCKKVREDIFMPAFEVKCSLNNLQASARKSCRLCQLFLGAYQSRRGIERSAETPTITFQRSHSSFIMNGTGSPVLSIFRSPDMATGIDDQIQVGHPGLPSVQIKNETSFELLRQWLKSCDLHHKTCSEVPGDLTRSLTDRVLGTGRLPTRVIAVGGVEEERVFLRETTTNDHGSWIALSHQWGTGKQFCTTVDNRDTYIDNGIDVGLLPDTFHHAVKVTRALGQPYLWIDSLCIVQGPGGDFNKEAKRMEQVYSGAYCVLASSRCPGHYAGFLEDRKPREAIVLQQKGQPGYFSISQNIDDFNQHVLNGSLNKRGWVLQEHALARRTVYFTDHQIYFECGDGVRCESLTRMFNERATFLGDPNFPLIIMKADRGERILRYQDLYSRYSRLGLSEDHDRAMAIEGLQDRILKALNAKGGYGAFDEGDNDGRRRGLLRRSLLWRRGKDVNTLPRIDFPKNHPLAKVPSWSWMACSGGIDYIELPFAGVDWMEVKSPWSSYTPTSGDNGGPAGSQECEITLIATAQAYHDPLLGSTDRGRIILDCPGVAVQPKTLCVLGKQKGSVPPEDRVHYVLLISPTTKKLRSGTVIYERVGAGTLPARCIGSEMGRVHIQ